LSICVSGVIDVIGDVIIVVVVVGIVVI